MDLMVLQTQQWLNRTYTGRTGYNPVTENGKTGWETMYGLTRALQIELGIATPADNFGPTTLQYLSNIGPISINSNTNSNIVLIIQGGMYCKGYSPEGFTGYFGTGTQYGISEMQTDLGIQNPDGVVTPKLFKALLTMDAYVLLSGGGPQIRSAQQWLNSKYINRKNFFYIPCDGYFSRDVQKALVYGIQYEEGLDDATANGNFGPTTQRLLPTLNLYDVDGSHSFVHLFQAAMTFNHYDVPIDGIFSQSVSEKVKEFQKFTILSQTGIGDFQTWASLLVSTGDTSRKGKACDSITEVTLARGAALKTAGYETVGRYLTNVEGSTLNKKIQPGELDNIFASGLTVFPIYQTYGGEASYFNYNQGMLDATAAYNAAKSYCFDKDTTIYFAVDYDAYGDDITNNILPHFKGINDQMTALGGLYKIGVYAPRSICSQVSENELASTSFVSGMSTGYSGNLGYPLPYNWAFDQISTVNVGSGDGYINIDNDIKSNRDNGSSSVGDTTGINDKCFDQLGKISLLAMQYSESTDWDPNFLVTNYYRKNRYADDLWATLSGPIITDFVDFVNQSMGDQTFIDIVDPITRTTIDIQHMMATLSALLFNKLPYNQDVNDFAGWGGDLVTVAIDVLNHKNDTMYSGDTYKCALDFIASKVNQSYFGFGDYGADTDAFNFCLNLDNNTHPIYNTVTDYYQSGVLKRSTLFYGTRFNSDQETLTSAAQRIMVSQEDLEIVTLRAKFKSVNHVPDYSDDDGMQIANAFITVLLNAFNHEAMEI
ncbi:glycoside hydrolase domain-containing protein [Bacillota bacterium Lsc_1132]